MATLFYSEVTAGHREQEQDTEVVITCSVSGLTRALDEVKWLRGSDDTEIADGDVGFTVNAAESGAGFEAGTEVTTLTVADTATGDDATYKCVITSNEHDVTERSETVNLKVFSK